MRRIDVLLVDLVQRLDGAYPELPYGVISRCVEVARRNCAGIDDDDPARAAVHVERAARQDIERLVASLGESTGASR